MGYKEITASYVLRCSQQTRAEIFNLIENADAVITDAEYLELTNERYRNGKLIFRYSERLFKSKLRYLKAPIHAFKAFKTRRMHLLCSSAFTARDFGLLGFYRGQAYKWGYFPLFKSYDDNRQLVENKRRNSILWVGRLIDWKHPESTIYVADRLWKEGYEFDLNIIGVGKMETEINRMIEKLGLKRFVCLLGSMSPEEVRAKMEESEIFLFTSDEGEGWGAVLNEAMNSGCAVVAGDKIGAVPFLINEGKNGLSFRNKNWDDLYRKVKFLIDHPIKRKEMAVDAIDTIAGTWNAEQAAARFIALATDLLEDHQPTGTDGPCSLA